MSTVLPFSHRNIDPSIFSQFLELVLYYHNTIEYTYFTYRAFQAYQERFQEPPSQILIEISAYLISSICFTQVDTAEFWVVCLTFHKTFEFTQGFNRQVNSRCRQRVCQFIRQQISNCN